MELTAVRQQIVSVLLLNGQSKTHGLGLRITLRLDPDPGTIPGLAQPLLSGATQEIAAAQLSQAIRTSPRPLEKTPLRVQSSDSVDRRARTHARTHARAHTTTCAAMIQKNARKRARTHPPQVREAACLQVTKGYG